MAHQKKKRRLLFQRVLIVAVAILAAVALAAVGVAVFLPRYRYNPMSETPSELGVDKVFDQKVVNIALFGIDSRDPDMFSGLSDSIMVLSLNTETKQIKLLSIMRDSLVQIEQNGKKNVNKMNAAYNLGGASLAIKTINQNFGLDISEYVTVNFYGLAHIIDALGGIDITLTETEVKGYSQENYPAFNDYVDEICINMGVDAQEYYITSAGSYHVNGVQAVAYSRIRYMPNVWGGRDDFGRTDRQRYVLEQLFEKTKTMSKSQYVKLAKALFPYVETSLSYSESVGLALDMLLYSPTFTHMRIPRYEFVMNSPSGVWGDAVYYDLEYASRVIKAVLYEDMTIDAFEELYPVEKKSWYKANNQRG